MRRDAARRGPLDRRRADAATALEPLAGHLAALLFGCGLLGAALLAAAIVPLASAYSVSEALGHAGRLDSPPAEAPAFYGTYAGPVMLAVGIVLILGVPLVPVLFLSQALTRSCCSRSSGRRASSALTDASSATTRLDGGAERRRWSASSRSGLRDGAGRRDHPRARDAVRADLMRCRHRLSKLLLRRGIRFDDGRAWTDRHRAWLAGIDLGHEAAQTTLADAIGAVDALCHRRDQLEREILVRIADSPWSTQVGRLRCLRGIDTLTAAGCAPRSATSSASPEPSS